MPQTLTIILVLAGVMAVFAVVFWVLIKKALAPKDENKNGDRAALMMQEQLKDIKEALHKTNLDIRNTLDSRIGESTKAMQSQIGHSSNHATSPISFLLNGTYTFHLSAISGK